MNCDYSFLQKFLIFFVLLFSQYNSAVAENEKINAVTDQLQIIAQDLKTLEKAVYKTSDITVASNSTLSNGLNEEILTRHLLKLNEIEEEFRLLYVAMTRAESWLIICGSGRRNKNGDCWYDTIENGIKSLNIKTDGNLEEARLTVQSKNWKASDSINRIHVKSNKNQIPKWVKNKLGLYYLYFSNHEGSYIRLTFSNSIKA